MSLRLGLDLTGSLWSCCSSRVLDALLGVALGLLASAFARTEFQAMQFMPVIVLPQLLLCGLFQPRSEMATVLRWASNVLPLSYAVSALQRVASATTVGAGYARDVAVVAGCALLALAVAAVTATTHPALTALSEDTAGRAASAACPSMPVR